MTTANHRTAVAPDTGRACPYCRFPLKEGVAICECGDCHAVHHADCWMDNRGCAIVGCTGSTAPAPAEPLHAAPVSSPLPPAPPHAPIEVTAAPVESVKPNAPAQKGPWLIVAVFVLALAVAGAGAAYFFTARGPGSSDPAPVTKTPRHTTLPVQTEDPGTGPDTQDSTPEPPPVVSDRVQIQRVLERYYGDVVDGDYDGAWALLSTSYKRWKSGNGGRPKWESQEQADYDYLDPSGLTVSIKRYDRATGVATIYVSGMHYGPDRCAYVGYTWARKVSGTWFYDQGYLQDATRAAEWRPRSDETLGVPCEENRY